MPFKIIREDIAKIKTDAVVDIVSSNFFPAGGDNRASDRNAGGINIGEAVIAPAHKLKAKYVIRTAGAVWQDGKHGEEEKVKLCYENSLKLALKQGCGSIAFPLTAAGTAEQPNFPKEKILSAAVEAVREFLRKEEMLVYLAAVDKAPICSGKLTADMKAYIDQRHTNKPHKGTEDSYDDGRCIGGRKPTEYLKMPAAGAATGLFLPAVPPAFIMRQNVLPRQVKESKRLKGKLRDIAANVGETFQERLFRYIDERGISDVEVYKRANLSRQLFSKIRSNSNYRPTKETALVLAVALELNLDETKDLLSRAGLALSPSSVSDLLIEYCILERIYDIYEINCILHELDQPTLGG